MKESIDEEKRSTEYKENMQLQEDELVRRMMELSAKQYQDSLRNRQEEEDEMLRLAMEQSMREEEERLRRLQRELELANAAQQKKEAKQPE